jgi:hypothetical protein
MPRQVEDKWVCDEMFRAPEKIYAWAFCLRRRTA